MQNETQHNTHTHASTRIDRRWISFLCLCKHAKHIHQTTRLVYRRYTNKNHTVFVVSSERCICLIYDSQCVFTFFFLFIFCCAPFFSFRRVESDVNDIFGLGLVCAFSKCCCSCCRFIRCGLKASLLCASHRQQQQHTHTFSLSVDVLVVLCICRFYVSCAIRKYGQFVRYSCLVQFLYAKRNSNDDTAKRRSGSYSCIGMHAQQRAGRDSSYFTCIASDIPILIWCFRWQWRRRAKKRRLPRVPMKSKRRAEGG